MKQLLTIVCSLALALALVACGSDSSTSTNTEEQGFALKDGVIWEPSYGERAMTFFNENRNADNFFTLKEDDGTFFGHTDSDEGGTSTVKYAFSDTSLDITFSNVYKWKKSAEGFEYDPFPYSSFGFVLVDSVKSVDVSSWEGGCFIYESSKNFEFFLSNPGAGQWYWRVLVPASSEKSMFQFKWTDMKRQAWAENPIGLEEALESVVALMFESNDSTFPYNGTDKRSVCKSAEEACEPITLENTVKIYKIGKFGACG